MNPDDINDDEERDGNGLTYEEWQDDQHSQEVEFPNGEFPDGRQFR